MGPARQHGIGERTLGHVDVPTKMIYVHVLDKGRRSRDSPVDYPIRYSVDESLL
jgi:hypothetical protein